MFNAADASFLQLARLAELSASSEHPEHPVRGIVESPSAGWRAAEPGEQWVRIMFTSPQHVNHVRVIFREAERERTQLLTVRWWPGSYHHVITRQCNFGPEAAVEHVENYSLNLSGVTGLELRIVPDVSDSARAFASVAALQMA